jgi:hypothetical protein
LKTRPAIASALSAGVVALVAYSLPYRLGLILAAIVGIAVGTFLESTSRIEPVEELPIQANLRETVDNPRNTQEEE